MAMTREVEVFFEDGCGRCALGGTPACKVRRWGAELRRLRGILLEAGGDGGSNGQWAETAKWGVPVYTFNGANVAILGALKGHCSVGFFKGVLLEDPQGVLVAPGPNSQAVRQMRFTGMAQVEELAGVLRAHVQEAIRVEASGRQVAFTASEELAYPDEMRRWLEADPALEAAFEGLTPGRRRGYVLHISGAKQAATRHARMEKVVPRIMEGKGMHDR